MKYSILKDEKPQNTINKIKNVLNSLDFQLTEEFFIDDTDSNAPVSLRVRIKDTDIGTNGKGTNRDNALASAYAEFIERLQNMCLSGFDQEIINLIPDKVTKTKKLKYEDKELNNYFKNKISTFFKQKESNQLMDFTLVPYYSVNDKSVCELPLNIIVLSKGTNGMAAGNTYEEALVQGLSEICERYALRETFLKKLSLPTVPKEEYLKYETINNLLNYYKNCGYEVTIKDASIGGKLPVICTIIENLKDNIIYFSFGAQPTIPIAIERTLTEFAQGIIIRNHDRRKHYIPLYSKTKLKYANPKDIFHSLACTKIAFIKTKKIYKDLIEKKNSYTYSNNAWIQEKETYSNSELLGFLVNAINNITPKIYVRDVSFLGFPSVDIFIPNMSELFDVDKETFTNFILDRDWGNYQKKSKDVKYNLNSLMKLAEVYTFFVKNPCYSQKTFDGTFEYIALLSAIALKDKKKIIKFSNIVLDQNKYDQIFDDEQILTIKIIKDFFKIQDVDKEQKIKKLEKKYDKDDILYAIDIIEDLTFDLILDIIVKKKKEEKIPKSILKKISKKYRENKPDQVSLKEIFDKCDL